MNTILTEPAVAGLLFTLGTSLCAQPVPHHFSGISGVADGTVALTLDDRIAGRPGTHIGDKVLPVLVL